MAKNKKKKNKKGKKKKNSKLFANLGFDLDAVKNYLPGAWKTNLQTLRDMKNEIKIPSKAPNNKFYNIDNAGVVNNTNEFIYSDRTMVERNTPYHIHIDPDTKKETYMTEAKHEPQSVKIFRVNGNTLLGQYRKLKANIPPQDYVEPYEWNPAKKDIKRGFSKRYFVRQSYGDELVFEINELDSNKSVTMYEQIKVDWAVGYNKKVTFDKNTENLQFLEESGFEELLDVLDAYDGYLGPEDVLENKLLSLDSSVIRFDPSKMGGKKKNKKGGKKKKKKKKGGSKGGASGGSQGGSSGGSSGGGGAY